MGEIPRTVKAFVRWIVKIIVFLIARTGGPAATIGPLTLRSGAATEECHPPPVRKRFKNPPTKLSPCSSRGIPLAARLGAAQARSAEQQGNTFRSLFPSQRGNERGRAPARWNLPTWSARSLPNNPRRLSKGSTDIRRVEVRTKRDSFCCARFVKGGNGPEDRAMICAARNEAHGFRVEAWAEGRERREDGADDRCPPTNSGVCGAGAASAPTVPQSPRRKPH